MGFCDMRVGIVALLHESNTFIRQPTTLAHFEQGLILDAESVRQRLADSHHEIGGFFEGFQAQGIEAVPIFAARGPPYGIVEADAFENLLARMAVALDRAGNLDGLLVAPHGATVSGRQSDADGY